MSISWTRIVLTYPNDCLAGNLLWALEERMRILAHELLALGFGDEYDRALEECIWRDIL